MSNHPSRRYIFKFSDFNINYVEANQLLDNAPAGAEYWDFAHYGKAFRLSTKPSGKYIYTYDTWCKYSQKWTLEGVTSCVDERSQRYIRLDELRRYYDEYTASIHAIDRDAVNNALAKVIKAFSEFSACAAEAMTKGIEGTLYDLSLKQASSLAALAHLRSVEQGMIVDSDIIDFIQMNTQALRINEIQRDAEVKKLFLPE